jgi:hypothetical protein
MQQIGAYVVLGGAHGGRHATATRAAPEPCLYFRALQDCAIAQCSDASQRDGSVKSTQTISRAGTYPLRCPLHGLPGELLEAPEGKVYDCWP